MKPKISISLLITICIIACIIGKISIQKNNAQLSEITLANIEALASYEETQKYDRVDRVKNTIIDFETGERRTVVTYICDGIGDQDCG